MNPHAVESSVKLHNSHVIPKNLKDGSQVLVRIIQNLGNNKYLGSVAGVRSNIYSDKNYVPGDTFKANVSVKDGVIILKQKDESQITFEAKVILENISQSSIENPLENVSSQALFNFIKNMGMVPDNLSNMILQQMKNLGLKFNVNLMNKIHDISAKYKGKEALAVELMMSFLEKGMEFDPDILDSLILSLEDDYIEHKNKEDKKRENKEVFSNNTVFLSGEKIKQFVQSLLFSQMENPIGVLSIANNLGSQKDSSGAGSWLLLPYEIKNQDEIISQGKFRLLLSKEKKLLKFCIESKIEDRQQYFILEFINNSCKRIKLCQVHGMEETQKEELLERINSKIKEQNLDTQVLWCDYKSIIGNGFGEEKITLLDGVV